ncbi:MAG: DUF4956 domain-containing protein, partial [Erysipelotrichales bacterium]
MSFLDLIQKGITEEFTGTVSLNGILMSLFTAFLIAVFIIYVYRRTYSGVIYSKSFSLLLILLAMVTTLIVRTIASNLALSLGMVGALSIVRFRTAVKDPMDTGFISWAIMAGSMAGIGLYLIAIISSLAVGFLFILSHMFEGNAVSRYLLIVKFDYAVHDAVYAALKTLPKHKLRSKTLVSNKVELTFDIEIKDKTEHKINGLKQIAGVDSVSLI